jgi:hypothetical protein
VVVQGGAGGGEGVLEQPDHGQHGGSGVDPEAGFLDHAGAPAGDRLPVDHHDLVTAAGEMARSRQAAETGPHHDRAHAPG